MEARNFLKEEKAEIMRRVLHSFVAQAFDSGFQASQRGINTETHRDAVIKAILDNLPD